MNELIAHSMIYPEMEIQDAVKLLYQQTFGSEHMAVDVKENLLRLKEEYENAGDNASLIEPIGNGIARIYLSAAKKEGISPELIQKLFLKAMRKKASVGELNKRLKLFSESCKNGVLPFDVEKTDSFIDMYKKQGFPPISHSEAYKKAYSPSYRLILTEHARLLPLLAFIDSQNKNETLVIGIDGKCGSGKTTLALLLEELFSASTIHMDDFFLPYDMRTAERLSEAGGNIHYERFEKEVIPNLKSKNSFSYRKFNCMTGDFAGELKISGNIRVVEGSYSMHNRFSAFYDYKVFLDITPEKQKERIISRSGESKWEDFEKKWIPMENKYFEAVNVKSRCDFTAEL